MTQVSFHSTQDVLVDVTVINDRHMAQVSFYSTQDELFDVTVINDRTTLLKLVSIVHKMCFLM